MADTSAGANNHIPPRVPPRGGRLARPGFDSKKVTTWMRSTGWPWFPATPELEAKGGSSPYSVGIGW